MPTFLCDVDYVRYTDLMAEWCEERGVEGRPDPGRDPCRSAAGATRRIGSSLRPDPGKFRGYSNAGMRQVKPLDQFLAAMYADS